MPFSDLLVGFNISSSGLAAERTRMEVVAGNIANANSTRGPDGQPYRRKEVLFETVLQQQMGGRPSGIAAHGMPMPTGTVLGVRVAGVQDDNSDFPTIYQPGHPDADSQGFLRTSNVQLPMEMVNLMTASRAYEANLKVLQSQKKDMEQVISILRS
jgi:flagellar basal-body rod protein FlgC